VLVSINVLLVRAALPPAAPSVVKAAAGSFGTDDPVGDPTGQMRPGTGSESVAVRMVADNLTQYRDSVVRTLLTQSGLTLAAALALALLIGWVTASRVLRPVHDVTSTARRLHADRLDERIHMQGPRDELTELADTFDQMLDRLATSFESQRRFVANASHELRTPLATQRTMVEVAMARPTADPATRELCRRLLTMNVRLEALIDGLLTLARSDRGLGTSQVVRLDEVVSSVLVQHGATAARADVQLRTDLAPRTVHGDPVLLEQLVTNLVHNAITYNTDGGTVWLQVREHPALQIGNTGPLVPAESASMLFEPFRQLRQTPTGAGRGVGLGLSIVASIARAHGGSAQADPRDGGGLEVTVLLP
jgi:signal transduction histidine kinase